MAFNGRNCATKYTQPLTAREPSFVGSLVDIKKKGSRERAELAMGSR